MPRTPLSSKIAIPLVAAAFIALGVVAAMRGAGAAPAAGKPAEIPEPTEFVTDSAGVIDAANEATLKALLEELEEKTGVQFLILTVDTTGGVPIDDFTFALAQKWQLGQAGKDNGALLVVAVKDRKYCTTVGYGLERTLTDSFIGRVGRTYFVPNFRKGNYGAGIREGALAVLTRLEGDYGVRLTNMPRRPVPYRRSRSRGPLTRLVPFLLPLLFIVIVIVFVLRRGVLFRQGSGYYWGGGSWGSSGGFGGGFGGGGGGFSGGGGGSFGGGGASGSW